MLRVGPRGSVLTQTPVLPSSENHVQRRWQVALEASGDARVDEELIIRGQAAPNWREHYQTEGERKDRYGRVWSGRFSGARLDSVAMPGIEDRNAPVTVRAGVTVPRLARASGGGRAGSAGDRARRRLRPDVRAPVGAAAGAGARLSVAARRGADLPPAVRLDAGGGRAARAPGDRRAVRAVLAGCGDRRQRVARAVVAQRHPRAHQRRRLPEVSRVPAGGRRRAGQPDRRVCRRRWDHERAPRGGAGASSPRMVAASCATTSPRGAGSGSDEALAGWQALAEGRRARRAGDVRRRLRAAPARSDRAVRTRQHRLRTGRVRGGRRRLRRGVDRARRGARCGMPAMRRCWRPSPRAASSRSTTRSARPRAAGSSIGWRPRACARPRAALARARRAGAPGRRTRRARSGDADGARARRAHVGLRDDGRRSRVDRAARERGPGRAGARFEPRAAERACRDARRAAAWISPRRPTGGAGRGWSAWRSRARPAATTSSSTTRARAGCLVDGGRAARARIGDALRPPHLRRARRARPPAGTTSSFASPPGRASPGSRCTSSGWIGRRWQAAPESASSIPVIRARDAARRQAVRRRRGHVATGAARGLLQGRHRPAYRGDRRARSRWSTGCARGRGSRSGLALAASIAHDDPTRPASIARDAARSALRAAVAVDPRSGAALARSGGARAGGRTSARRDRGGPGGRARGARLVGAAAVAGARVHGARARLRRQSRGRGGGARAPRPDRARLDARPVR